MHKLACVVMVVACGTSETQSDRSLELFQVPELPQLALPVLAGTITIDGCTPPASSIVVTAAQSTLGTPMPLDPQAPQQVAPPVVYGRVLPTRDPHEFTFVVANVDVRERYRLGARLAAGAGCAKLAWHGPSGWLAAGTAYHIDGFAMRTQTEVLATRDGNPLWVAVDAIDLGDPQGAVRALRWRSDVPGVTAARVEISADKFYPDGISPIQRAPRILASFTMPASSQQPNDWNVLPAYDFAQLVQPQCDPQLGCSVCDPRSPNGCSAQGRTSLGALQNELRHGAPIYIRVVPLGADGQVVGTLRDAGISSFAKVVHMPLGGFVPPPPPPPATPPLDYTIQYFRGYDTDAIHCNGGAYRITEDHYVSAGSCVGGPPFGLGPSDYWDCRIQRIWPGLNPITAGHRYCTTITSDDSPFAEFWDALSGFVDSIGDLVNGIANLYEKIKEDVLAAAASVITDLGAPFGLSCDTICQDALEGALDAGLAAVGLPPSLPNWDEVKDAGIDYLEQEAAEETGVDKDIIKTAVDLTVDAMHSSSHPEKLASYITPDDGFRPPRVTLTIAKDPAYAGFDYPNNFRFYGSTRYIAPEVTIPDNPLNRGESVVVPLALLPNTAGIARYCVPDGLGGCTELHPLTDELVEDTWFNSRYASAPCFPFVVDGTGVGFLTPGTKTTMAHYGVVIDWSIPTLADRADTNPLLPLECVP